MRHSSIFAVRVSKEILRDPLSVFFGVCFPIVLIVLLSTINKNIPNNMFDIALLAPGVAVFSLSFLALFAGQMIAKDRDSAFMLRLFTTPMKAGDFILGYTLPLMPFALLQTVICYVTGLLFGLKITLSLLLSILFMIPVALVFVSIGLLCGSVLSEKATTGLCGALLTNLSAWLSGVWFDLDLVGGVFKSLAYVLPFVHSVDMVKAISVGQYTEAFQHFWWVFVYAVVILAAGVFAFKRHMKNR